MANPAPYDIDGHSEEFQTDEVNTEWPAAQLQANPGDYFLANQGTEFQYTLMDSNGNTIAVITFGAINNGDGTFTLAPNKGQSTSSPPASSAGGISTPPSLTAVATTYYDGPFAALGASLDPNLASLLNLGDDILDGQVEVFGQVEWQPDPITGKYAVRVAGAADEVQSSDLGDNVIGKRAHHHHNWETGCIINAAFTTLNNVLTLQSISNQSPVDLTNGYAIPKFVPDGPLPNGFVGPVSLFLGVTVPNTLTWSVTIVPNASGTQAVDSNNNPITGLYQNGWPNGNPAGAYVLLDLSDRTNTPPAPKWFTALPTTDMDQDAFANKIKVGIMSDQPDPAGNYVMHGLYAGTIAGIGSQGFTIADYSILSEQKDYPKGPTSFNLDNFDIEFDPATKDSILYSTTDPTFANSGWRATVHAVPYVTEGVTQTPVVYQIDGPAGVGGVAWQVNTADIAPNGWIARAGYYLYFNASTSNTPTLTNNMVASNIVGSGGPGQNGNPTTAFIPPLSFGCLYNPPPASVKQLLRVGRIGFSPQKEGGVPYLYIRGWHHGRNINPGHPKANILPKESLYPNNSDRFSFPGSHIELGAPTGGQPNYQSMMNLVENQPGDDYVIDIEDPAVLNPDGSVNTNYVTGRYGTPSFISQAGVPTQEVTIVLDSTVPTGSTQQVGYVPHVLIKIPSAGRTNIPVNASWYIVFNESSSPVRLISNYTSQNSNTVPAHSLACVRYKPTNTELYPLGQISKSPDTKGYLYFTNGWNTLGLTHPALMGSGGTTEEIDRPKRAYNWKPDNFHLEFGLAGSSSFLTTVSIVQNPGTAAPPTITFKETGVTRSVVNGSFQVAGLGGGGSFASGENVYFNKNDPALNLPPVSLQGYQTQEGASSIPAGEMRAVYGIVNDPALVHIGSVAPAPDAAGYLFMVGWQHNVYHVSSSSIPPGGILNQHINAHHAGKYHFQNLQFFVSVSGGVQYLQWGDPKNSNTGDGNIHVPDTSQNFPVTSSYNEYQGNSAYVTSYYPDGQWAGSPIYGMPIPVPGVGGSGRYIAYNSDGTNWRNGIGDSSPNPQTSGYWLPPHCIGAAAGYITDPKVFFIAEVMGVDPISGLLYLNGHHAGSQPITGNQHQNSSVGASAVKLSGTPITTQISNIAVSNSGYFSSGVQSAVLSPHLGPLTDASIVAQAVSTGNSSWVSSQKTILPINLDQLQGMINVPVNSTITDSYQFVVMNGSTRLSAIAVSQIVLGSNGSITIYYQTINISDSTPINFNLIIYAPVTN